MFNKFVSTIIVAIVMLFAAPFSEAKKAAKPNDISIPTPAENKAQIVFFRPKKFAGSAVGFKVREGEVELGKLRNGNYFVVEVEPGKHVYTVHSEAKDLLNVEVEAGETFFAKGTISMGAFVGRPNLAPSNENEFRGEKLKPSKPLKKD